ncbi:RimJ/RimL family protein N-acetyltransferase [Catenulispora sp. EB89]|uniref:GNAT family N-acetyltransferase n=1 Tax=Catenulispora sp. EB89 TaxID=3156257 RepID=UPI003517DA7D
MTVSGPDTWPPAPIHTKRLVLRESQARDRPAIIDLFASEEVGTYVGGAQPREELERTAAAIPGRRFGFFTVELDTAMIGLITLDPHSAAHPGHSRPDLARTELGYMFLPHAWGHGYAAEACTAALDWFAAARPGEPVVLTTQVANESARRLAAKLGFGEVERYHEHGAEQWFGLWQPPGASR